MKVIDCQQGTHDWFAARAGRVTASEIVNVLGFLKRGDKKGEPTEGRKKYLAQIVAETLTGEPYLDGFLSKAMERGTEMEPFARTAYELKREDVDTLGFVIHPSIERAGASPDGLVGEDGMVEIKAPNTATHIDYMLNGGLPTEYEPQVMWNLACTERKWCDFVSFDSRLPERHQLFIVRVHRDEARIAELEQAVIQFLAEVDETIANLEKLNPELTQAQRVFGNDTSYITDDDIEFIKREQGLI